MIHLASVVNNTDFYGRGRNLENLGLVEMSLAEIENYLQTGRKG
jgi:hypothetical protein